MQTFILQDLTTIRGATSTNVTQNESGWLDMSAMQDLMIWTETKEVTGTVTISFQTSPTKDDALFTQMMAGIALPLGVTTTKVLLSAATIPVARYVRWVLTGPASTWDATFRCYVAGNSAM